MNDTLTDKQSDIDTYICNNQIFNKFSNEGIIICTLLWRIQQNIPLYVKRQF